MRVFIESLCTGGEEGHDHLIPDYSKSRDAFGLEGLDGLRLEGEAIMQTVMAPSTDERRRAVNAGGGCALVVRLRRKEGGGWAVSAAEHKEDAVREGRVDGHCRTGSNHVMMLAGSAGTQGQPPGGGGRGREGGPSVALRPLHGPGAAHDEEHPSAGAAQEHRHHRARRYDRPLYHSHSHHSVDTPSDHGGGVLAGVVEYMGLLPIRDDPHEGLDDGHRRRFLAGLTLMPYVGHNSFYNLMAKSKQASIQALDLFDPVRTFVHRPFSSDHPMRHTSYLLVRCSTAFNSGPSSRSRARSAKG